MQIERPEREAGAAATLPRTLLVTRPTVHLPRRSFGAAPPSTHTAGRQSQAPSLPKPHARHTER